MADEILVELADGKSLPNCFLKGNLFWLQYTAATMHNLKILIEQQMMARKWILQRSLNLRQC